MSQNIIFVDIDGPLLSRKSSMFHENRKLGINPDTGVGWYPKFDAFSIKAFNLWAKYGNAKIVFSTHWSFSHNTEQLKEIMQINGLGFDYHDVLYTPKKTTSHRSHEIVWWLHDNAEAGDKFIAVDDDTSCQDIESLLDKEYKGHSADATGAWINVDFDNGLSWDNFLDGCDVLGIEMDDIYEQEFNIKPLTKQQKEYREGLLGSMM
jgi:hypothetical protein